MSLVLSSVKKSQRNSRCTRSSQQLPAGAGPGAFVGHRIDVAFRPYRLGNYIINLILAVFPCLRVCACVRVCQEISIFSKVTRISRTPTHYGRMQGADGASSSPSCQRLRLALGTVLRAAEAACAFCGLQPGQQHKHTHSTPAQMQNRHSHHLPSPHATLIRICEFQVRVSG